MANRRTVVWSDAAGHTAAHLLTVTGSAAAVQAAIMAKSNAGVVNTWEGPLLAPAVAAVAAVYQEVTDQAVLVFQTGSGALVKVIVPAPHSSIFQADQETVDAAQITALIAAVLADVVTPAGTALTAYVAGVRTRTR